MNTFPFPVPPFLQVFRNSERGEWRLLTHDARHYLAITDEVIEGPHAWASRFVADRIRELCKRIGKESEYAAWEAPQ